MHIHGRESVTQVSTSAVVATPEPPPVAEQNALADAEKKEDLFEQGPEPRGMHAATFAAVRAEFKKKGKRFLRSPNLDERVKYLEAVKPPQGYSVDQVVALAEDCGSYALIQRVLFTQLSLPGASPEPVSPQTFQALWNLGVKHKFEDAAWEQLVRDLSFTPSQLLDIVGRPGTYSEREARCTTLVSITGAGRVASELQPFSSQQRVWIREDLTQLAAKASGGHEDAAAARYLETLFQLGTLRESDARSLLTGIRYIHYEYVYPLICAQLGGTPQPAAQAYEAGIFGTGAALHTLAAGRGGDEVTRARRMAHYLQQALTPGTLDFIKGHEWLAAVPECPFGALMPLVLPTLAKSDASGKLSRAEELVVRQHALKILRENSLDACFGYFTAVMDSCQVSQSMAQSLVQDLRTAMENRPDRYELELLLERLMLDVMPDGVTKSPAS